MSGKEIKGIEKVELNDGNVYKIEFDFYALEILEARAGGKFEDIFKLFEDFTIKNVNFILWASLLKHHPELEDLTERERKRWFANSLNGQNFEPVFNKVSEAFNHFWNQENGAKKN